jgi:uncharacterized protein YmfQ (DUF2313 family)
MTATRDAAAALLPPGGALTRARSSNLGRLLDAICVSFEQAEDRILDLLAELSPLSSTELINRWSVAVGVDESCLVTGDVDERRAAIVARLRTPEDASLASLTDVATSLGYSAPTYGLHDLFVADASRAGDAVRAALWAHVLDIHIESGDADSALRCNMLDRIQAHVLARFIWE